MNSNRSNQGANGTSTDQLECNLIQISTIEQTSQDHLPTQENGLQGQDSLCQLHLAMRDSVFASEEGAEQQDKDEAIREDLASHLRQLPQDEEFSLFMQPMNGVASSSTPSSQANPKNPNGKMIFADNSVTDITQQQENPPFTHDLLQGAPIDSESGKNHLGSTIKFQHQDSQEFDSDGLFSAELGKDEAAISDREQNFGVEDSSKAKQVVQPAFINREADSLGEDPYQRTHSGSTRRRAPSNFDVEQEHSTREQHELMQSKQIGPFQKQNLHINLSGLSTNNQGNPLSGGKGGQVKQIDPNLLDSANSQDPYFYLQWRQQQQKQHKSCRSTLYNTGGSSGAFSKKGKLNSNQVIYYNKQQQQFAPGAGDYGQVGLNHPRNSTSRAGGLILNPGSIAVPHTLRVKGGSGVQKVSSFSYGNRDQQTALNTAGQSKRGGKNSISTPGGTGVGAGKYQSNYSSFSNSSNTTGQPVASLRDVKKPNLLISFRFHNRKATSLEDIGLFRNLTELDVSGNLLQSAVPQLSQLNFLKKLNLAANQISEMWMLPRTLEYLNYSGNCLKKLNPEVTQQLTKLTTLDVNSNGLENLDGVQNLICLSRLQARNNQIQDLSSLETLTSLIEIDLENNPIDCFEQVLLAAQNKKDILVFNLKLSPLMVNVVSYEQFIEDLNTAAKNMRDRQLMDGREDSQISQNLNITSCISKLLKFLHAGVLYRNQRIYAKIKQLNGPSPNYNTQGRGQNGKGFYNLSTRSFSVHQQRTSGNDNNAKDKYNKSSPGGGTNGVAFSPLLQNKHNQFGSGGGGIPRKKTRLASTQFRSCRGQSIGGKNVTSSAISALAAQQFNQTGQPPQQVLSGTTNRAGNHAPTTSRQGLPLAPEGLDKLYEEMLNEEELHVLRLKRQRRRKRKRLQQKKAAGEPLDSDEDAEEGQDHLSDLDDEDLEESDVDDIDESDDELDYLDDEDDLYDFQMPSNCYGSVPQPPVTQKTHRDNMLMEESLDDLQTYHEDDGELSEGFPVAITDEERVQHHANGNALLNESTADFGGQLRQAKQELRDEGLLDQDCNNQSMERQKLPGEYSLTSFKCTNEIPVQQKEGDSGQELDVQVTDIEIIDMAQDKKDLERNTTSTQQKDKSKVKSNPKLPPSSNGNKKSNPGFKLDLSKCNLLTGSGKASPAIQLDPPAGIDVVPPVINTAFITPMNAQADKQELPESQSFRNTEQKEEQAHKVPLELALVPQQVSTATVVVAQKAQIQQATPKTCSQSTNRVARRINPPAAEDSTKTRQATVNKLVVVRRDSLSRRGTSVSSKNKGTSKLRTGSSFKLQETLDKNCKFSKPIFIPKLALQNIHRQTSDMSQGASSSFTAVKTATTAQNITMPKNFIVLSGQGSGQKQSSIKEQQETEYEELIEELNNLRRAFTNIQHILIGKGHFTDAKKIVDLVRQLKTQNDNSKLQEERLHMTIEDYEARLHVQNQIQNKHVQQVQQKVSKIKPNSQQSHLKAKISGRKPMLALGQVTQVQGDFSSVQLNNLINVAQKQMLSSRPKVMASTTRGANTSGRNNLQQLNSERYQSQEAEKAQANYQQQRKNAMIERIRPQTVVETTQPDDEAMEINPGFQNRAKASQEFQSISQQSFLDQAKMKIINKKQTVELPIYAQSQYQTSRIPRTTSARDKIIPNNKLLVQANKTERKNAEPQRKSKQQLMLDGENELAVVNANPSSGLGTTYATLQQYTTCNIDTKIKPLSELATFISYKHPRSDFKTQRAGSAAAATYADCMGSAGQQKRFGLYLEKMRERNSSLQERLLMSSGQGQINCSSQHNLALSVDKGEKNLSLTSQGFEPKQKNL